MQPPSLFHPEDEGSMCLLQNICTINGNPLCYVPEDNKLSSHCQANLKSVVMILNIEKVKSYPRNRPCLLHFTPQKHYYFYVSSSHFC
jgi:hypothetical protein